MIRKLTLLTLRLISLSSSSDTWKEKSAVRDLISKLAAARCVVIRIAAIEDNLLTSFIASTTWRRLKMDL